MNRDVLLISLLTVAGIGLLGWAGYSTWNTNRVLNHTQERYSQAVESELSDKCTTPDGYTETEWREHMSHHPNRYQECFADNQPKPTYKTVSVNDLRGMLDVKNFTLFDVHTPKQPHIPGTDAAVSYDTIAQSDQLPTDKSSAIVLYCRSGNMSERAAQELAEMGYTNVYHVAGGTNAWSDAGYELTESL